MKNKKTTVISQLSTIVVLLSLGVCACAQAQTSWLNIMGDADDSTLNTIEVAPTPVAQTKDGRILRVRVSRSAERHSWDGIAYRSYQSQVLFDCASSSARYLWIEFYREPGWKGAPYHTSVYSDQPRLMEFRDVTPNPAQRIVRAACQSAGITAN